MKNLFILLSFFQCLLVQAQDSIKIRPRHSQVFALSPLPENLNSVNGLAIGVGHYEPGEERLQFVNGLNIEASPLGIVLPLIPLSLFDKELFGKLTDNFPSDTTKTYIVIRGLNISSGGFMEGAKMHGVNISAYTHMNQMSGLSISPGITSSYEINGLSIAAMCNSSVKMSGASIGFANSSEILNGLQWGILNFSATAKGAQIGFYNRKSTAGGGMQIGMINDSGSRKGLQLGIWNTNAKRALPLINW
jgi:hypothetical protein